MSTHAHLHHGEGQALRWRQKARGGGGTRAVFFKLTGEVSRFGSQGGDEIIQRAGVPYF